MITSWNAAAQRLYGYTADEAIGQPIAMIIPPDRRGEELDILRRVLDGGKVDHFETQRLAQDGRIVDVSISVSPVRNAAGEIVEAAIIARDLTQQKQAERELAEARAEQAAVARRQALELNDEVVQGLAAAKLALETGELQRGLASLSATLVRAQRIVTHLLEEHGGGEPIRPGDLIREKPLEPPSY